ncbi:MAG TPA: tRNA pseudouridine(38-40) synthase TruA [Vicinamibacteria bacterium]|jgi:tRNA pseudouridine38-40 synthase|nr:tRNA pseudouridine(38-40) synthase TruA [Vicinamibacteria bacterium]
MTTYRVTLAYDGTDFAGWQAQAPAAARTVQGTIEDALQRLTGGARVAIAGAGRTDAGVHALGQVASFGLDPPWDAARLARALNAVLPADVRVVDAAAAPADFHARRDAVGKLYRYVLDTASVQVPTRRRTAGHVPWALDPGALAAVAALFVGRHDFAALASAGGSVQTTVRTVTRSEVSRADPSGSLGGQTWVYEVEASGFLRKMVRSMVGALVEAGRGAWSVERLQAALGARDRSGWPAPAEARGLTLVRVAYARDLRPPAETGVR